MTKKVLVVEDYEDSREFMEVIITALGYQALTANNGEEAVKITREQIPDLILMDVGLPVMDGLTAAEIIRNSGADISGIPIIALTAHGNVVAEEAAEVGINEVVGKPLDYAALEAVLFRYLGS